MEKDLAFKLSSIYIHIVTTLSCSICIHFLFVQQYLCKNINCYSNLSIVQGVLIQYSMFQGVAYEAAKSLGTTHLHYVPKAYTP